MIMLITDRDRKILKFINEFGYSEMPQIQRMFGLSKSRGYKVVKRLVDAGLVVHEYILRNCHGIYRLTREGAECTDLPMLRNVSLGGYVHQLTVVDVYLRLMQRYPDATWISERRLKRNKFLEKGFCRHGHIADGMLIFPDSKKIAIEVELTMKEKDRLDNIIRKYALDSTIDGVWYYCSPEIVNKMRKAVDWMSHVTVFELGGNVIMNGSHFLVQIIAIKVSVDKNFLL